MDENGEKLHRYTLDITVMVHFSGKQRDDVIIKNYVINMSQSRISVSHETGGWSRYWEMHIAHVSKHCSCVSGAYGLTLTWMYAWVRVFSHEDMLSDTIEITMKKPTSIEIVLILNDIYDNT